MPDKSVPVVAQPPLAEVPNPTAPKATAGVWDEKSLAEALKRQYPETVRGLHTKSNTFVDVPPEVAERAFRGGHLQVDANTEYHVKLADGRIGTVPGSSLGSALDDGATMVSPRAARDAELARKYGASGGAAAATGLGFGEGLTSNFTDVGLSPSEAEAQDYINKKHPLAHGVGVGFGVAGQAAVTGAGGLVEDAASAGMRTLGAGARLSRYAGTAAREAVAGAQMAHTEAISEEALGNPELTAEKYWGSLAEGALYGGALGVAGTAAHEALGAIAKGTGQAIARRLAPATASDVDAVAQKTFGFVPEGIGEAYVKASSAAAGGGEQIIREAGIQNQSAAGRALRKDLLNIDEVRDTAARDVRAHVDTMLRGTEDLTEEAKGALKREYVRGAVKADDPAAIAKHSADTIASARSEIGSLLGDTDTYGQTAMLKRMDAELGRYEKQIATAAKAGDVGEQFALLDDAKRAVGRWTRATKQTSMRAAPDPVQLRQAQATYGKLESLYEGLRGNLENESVWGKAAADQRAINSAWTEQIAADKQFRGALATVVGEEKFGGKIYGADPSKITAYVSGLTNPDKDLVHQAVGRYTKATRDLAGALGEAYDLPAAKVAQVAKVVEASHAADKTLAEVGQKLSKANQLKALLDAEGESHGALALAGGLVGGRTGAALGALIEGVGKPGKSIMRLAQLEHMTQRFDGAIGKHVRAWLARGQKAAEGAPAPKPARLPRGGSPYRIAATEANAVRQQYAQRAARIVDWRRDPELVARQVAEHVSQLNPHAPKTAQAVSRVATAAALFLAQKLPQTPARDPLFGKSGTPSEAAMSKFLRYARAVENPQGVFEDLAKGRITSEQVEAIQAVYPQVYEELRGGVIRELAQGDRGASMTYQQRVQLGLLFDVEAAPSMAPDAAKHAQAVYSAPPAKPQGGGGGGKGKPMSLSRSVATPAERVEQGPAAG